MSRPAIPSEIRRAVLVEAGHRCALPTCRYPSVDVHHIVPWERSQSHDFENLIALCPNCHRRADAGEIDRKSLRIYKARLGASSIEPPSHSPEPNQPWHVEKLIEAQKGSPGYEFEFEYPVFEDPELAEVTELVKAAGIRELHGQRRLLHDVPPIEGYEDWPNWHSASFKIVRFDERLLSINYRNSSFGAGAAHANSYTSTYNFILNPLREMSVSDLFEQKVDYLDWLSKFCAAALLAARDGDTSREWVISGTAPKKTNFRSVAIDPNGLVVTFDAYQVDCYAAGPQVVHIPASEVRPLLEVRLRELF